MQIFLSRNGNRLAVAVIRRNVNGDSDGGVTVYENNNGAWVVIGETVVGGINVNHSGLQVCVSYTGDILVIGSRYYTEDSSEDDKFHIGRTRIFKYESGLWEKMGVDLVGDEQYD